MMMCPWWNQVGSFTVMGFIQDWVIRVLAWSSFAAFFQRFQVGSVLMEARLCMCHDYINGFMQTERVMTLAILKAEQPLHVMGTSTHCDASTARSHLVRK